MNQNNNANHGRRGFLGFLGSASGSLMLRSFATGIPAAVLLDPFSATEAQAAVTPKTLVLASSFLGDPMNANVPGTYAEAGCAHAADPAMNGVDIDFGGSKVKGAACWRGLGAANLKRTAFFHTATRTPVHGELNRVQRMLDETERNDMLISLIARELAVPLGSVQADPISLGATSGNELLTAQGRILGNVAPTSVKQALGGVDGALKDLTTLRDKEIDRIYGIYREHGTSKQITLLDAWAKARTDVRSISDTLITQLEEITTNDQAAQLKAAAVLAAMKISPIITVHLDFGGDNHNDTDLEREVTRHTDSIADIATFWETAEGLGIGDKVLFATLNVFGRTLKKKGTAGRDHNSGHHVMLMMGSGIQGGVVGGVELDPATNEYKASAIDSSSGAKDAGGDIPHEETLAAAGKTLAYALGVAEDRLDLIVEKGKTIKSMVA